MYESFFKLKGRPFPSAPSIERYFPAPGIETSRLALVRCIERAEGPGLLVGPAGTGKTLLLQLLAEEFRNTFDVVLLANGHLGTRREFFQAILHELALPCRLMDEGELRLMLVDHLSADIGGRQGLLLLLDEAHTFSMRLLEEARLLTNLVRRSQPLVRLILAGNPLLEERFTNPRLDSFNQRIAARCYLESWNRPQTEAYVAAQLAAAGADAGRIFSPPAFEAVYRATGGVPRLVNQVCDHSLVLAGGDFQIPLDADQIEAAWADLQQLPTPESLRRDGSAAAQTQSDPLVEYGDLEAVLEVGDDDSNVERSHHVPFPAAADGFRPLASIGPSSHSAIGLAKDPFGEEFDHEEVILDRYASGDTAGITARQQVHSFEGRLLAQLLAPYLDAHRVPRFTVVSGHANDDAEVQTSADAPTSLPVPDHELSVTIDTGALDQADFEWLTSGDPQSAAEPGSPQDDDRNLVLVEENPVSAVESSPRAARLARRHEFRQLFAALRRG